LTLTLDKRLIVYLFYISKQFLNSAIGNKFLHLVVLVKKHLFYIFYIQSILSNQYFLRERANVDNYTHMSELSKSF